MRYDPPTDRLSLTLVMASLFAAPALDGLNANFAVTV